MKKPGVAPPDLAPPDLAHVLATVRDRLLALGEPDVDAFAARLERWWPDFASGWSVAYGGHPSAARELERLVIALADRYHERTAALRRLDAERIDRPGWFQDPSMIGYVCYPGRFGGTLQGVAGHLDYLAELNVRYLHLMPILCPRAGEADGGYAVADYRAIDPALGTMDDLRALCDRLRARGMSLCVDFVLNHTAAEHEWAVRAQAGDSRAAAMYLIFPDRTLPDAYEATLQDTFPELAPGNFTRLEDGRWVWTTFHEYQWDLDWSNPTVFVEMADVLLNLANHGVDVLRLDAVAFMWKRLGTNCQNQPEVHDLLQALRAVARIAAPAVMFKAEAIVGPDDLMPYLGVGPHRGRVSDVAYHNTLMVQFWSALATHDARLMTNVLRDLPRKPSSTAWATYIRCHDDIGWAITEEDAALVGWDGRAHRMFLSSFYSGAFPGSVARGALFNYDPSTGDSRISGTFASLAGLEAALETDDAELVGAAIERIRLGHALIMAWDGIPLIYMGDEIGMCNDYGFGDIPEHATDSRWLHRPMMDWARADRRVVHSTPEGRVFADLRRLVAARRATPQLDASVPLEVLDLGDPGLFAFARLHPAGILTAIHNVTDDPRSVKAARVGPGPAGALRDLLDNGWSAASGGIDLPPRGVRWIVPRDVAA